MSTFYLLNTTFVGTTKYVASALINDAVDPKDAIEDAGGVLFSSSDAYVTAAALLCQSQRLSRGISDEACESKMFAAANYSNLQHATAALSDADPAAVAAAAAEGVGTDASRADHAHADPNRAAAGTTLTDAASQTIQSSEGFWRKIPTLGQGGSLTLGTVAAVAGDQICVTRSSTDAYAYAVVNGGVGVGTLYTFVAGQTGFAKFQFDGTNWALKEHGAKVIAASTTLPGTMSAADKTFLDGQHSAAGTALLDAASQTIAITAGTWRKISTLSQGGSLTLATTGAVAGDQIEITRLSTDAQTYAVVNGGGGAGTLLTFPSAKIGSAKFQYDGTNWALRSVGYQA